MSDSALVSAVVGAVCGAVGGVLTAGVVARIAVRSGDRYKARLAVRAVLLESRAVLAYDHSKENPPSQKPGAYINKLAIDDLAEGVLKQFPNLGCLTRLFLGCGLRCLVGRETLRHIETRLHLPARVREDQQQADADEHGTKALSERITAKDKNTVLGIYSAAHNNTLSAATRAEYYRSAIRIFRCMLVCVGEWGPISFDSADR